MKACIYRGTKQVGGTCVELVAGNQRLLLDFGLPLDGDPADKSLVPPVNTDNLCGTVISHPHIDHYGLLHHLPAALLSSWGSGEAHHPGCRAIYRSGIAIAGRPLPGGSAAN